MSIKDDFLTTMEETENIYFLKLPTMTGGGIISRLVVILMGFGRLKA